MLINVPVLPTPALNLDKGMHRMAKWKKWNATEAKKANLTLLPRLLLTLLLQQQKCEQNTVR